MIRHESPHAVVRRAAAVLASNADGSWAIAQELHGRNDRATLDTVLRLAGSSHNAVYAGAKGKSGDLAVCATEKSPDFALGRGGSNVRHLGWSYPTSGGCLEITWLFDRA